MDDFNRMMQQARRQQAREQQAKVDRDAEAHRAEPPPAEPPAAPEGSGKLVLERRQGEWRYYLSGNRLRGGEEVEVYVSPAIGWLRGRFQWGRRNTSPPSIRILAYHPEDPAIFLGELDVSLPADAVCRWPRDPR